jgi:hypothetical protein
MNAAKSCQGIFRSAIFFTRFVPESQSGVILRGEAGLSFAAVAAALPATPKQSEGEWPAREEISSRRYPGASHAPPPKRSGAQEAAKRLQGGIGLVRGGFSLLLLLTQL